ncbi:MAG: SBBP repeat-containing protein [Bacteroidota bacterium]
MKTNFLLLSLLIAGSLIFAQNAAIVQQEWVETFSSQDSIFNSATAIDVNGNIYVVGFTTNLTTSNDFTIIKYDTNGNIIWVQFYNGTGNGRDRATALALDVSGNVYVTGPSTNTDNNTDFTTIKYDANGVQQWVITYDNGGNDVSHDIAVDNNGNIFVTGESEDIVTGTDFVTIKYNTNGTQEWIKRYDFIALNDIALALDIDASGNLYVTGNSNSGTTQTDFATIKYDNSGNELWVSRHDGPGNSFDYPEDIIVDSYGFVYVTGSTTSSGANRDVATIKYDQNGNELWVRTHDNSGLKDYANSILLDNNNNIVITGSTTSNTSGTDYITIKYDNNGNQIWIQKYYGRGLDDNDNAVKITADNDDNLYITGSSYNGYNNDFATIKYNSDGVEQWVQTYNGTGNGEDIVSDLTVDSQGNVYITGQSFNGNNFDFATIKYSYRDIYIPEDNQLDPPSDNYIFYQNKGQIKDTDGNPRPDIKYYTLGVYPDKYITDDFLSYSLANVKDTLYIPDSILRVDMKLHRANETNAYHFEASNSRLNYFLAHIPEGRININGFQRIIYPEVYDNIDLHYYSNYGGFKFYFVVNPGGDADNIKLDFTGEDTLIEQNGGLTIRTAFGDIEYLQGAVYRINPAGNPVPMPNSGEFIVDYTSGLVSFDIQNYPSNHTLVIAVCEGHAFPLSPMQTANLDWSTYHSGASTGYIGDFGLHLCHDDEGNLYTVGKTSKSDFPALNQPFSYSGNFDSYASKFHPNTTHLWTTFYGGTEDDDAMSVAYNYVNGDIYFSGTVNSASIPIFPPVDPNDGSYYQGTGYTSTNPLSSDAYIARFERFNLYPKWFSFFSGAAADSSKAIAVDIYGNVYITGETRTTTTSITCLGSTNGGFPICNAYDNIHNGQNDIFLAKFDSDNKLIFSTFYGGGDNDYVFDMNITDEGTLLGVYIVGGTKSYDFPLETSGGNFNASQFISPKTAYISDFNLDGSLYWSTYFPNVTEFQSVTSFAGIKRVYAIGRTNYFLPGTNSCSPVTNGIPICNSNGMSFIQDQNKGFNDLFITQFNNNNLIWSTFYGGETNEYSLYLETVVQQMWGINKYIDADVDDNGNLYLIGVTEITDNSYQFPTLGSSFLYEDAINDGPYIDATDIFIAGFNSKNERFWSTLFGVGYPNDPAYLVDYSMDFGGGISAYKAENICFTGYTQTDDYPYECPGTGSPSYCNYSPAQTNLFPVATISRFINPDFNGIEENPISNNELDVIIYPNPTNDKVSILTDLDITKIEIFDCTGKLIFADISKNNSCDISGFSKGIYLIKAYTLEKILTSKFIKN